MHHARRAAIVLFCALLAACGAATRVLYQTADAALLVYIDRHLDLEGDQWTVARGAIRRFHAWHREVELPRYAAMLDQAAARMERGLAREDVDWAMRALRDGYAASLDGALEHGVELLDTLDRRNVAHLARHFGLEDRKRAHALSVAPAARERARVRDIAGRIEGWTGPLSGAQIELVRGFVRATEDYPRLAHEYRKRRQDELLEALEPAGDAAWRGVLRALLLEWLADRDALTREYRPRFVQLILDVDRSLTDRQRTHAVARLRGYAEDARWLARRA